MSDIDFSDNAFLINGVSSTAVTKTLKDSGLTNAAVAEIVGGWFVGVTGAVSPAAFKFSTVVQAVDPNCAITYGRTFAHTDWVDGESRVQAGMTPEELGVNARFHGIENEFDSVGAQFRSVGSCMAEIRADLVGVVRELEAKITALQNQLHGLRQETKPSKAPGILGTVTIDGKDQFITQFGDDFKFIGFETVPLKDPKGPLINPQREFRPENIQPDELVRVVAGLEDTLVQPGVLDLLERGEPTTVGELRRVASDVTLPTGESFGSVIANLPADTKFSGVNDALTKITEHVVGELPAGTATGLKTTVLTGEASGRVGGAVLNSGVDAIGLEANMVRALDDAGLGTVGKLSSASRADIAGALQSAGLDSGRAGSIFAKAALGRAVRNLPVQ